MSQILFGFLVGFLSGYGAAVLHEPALPRIVVLLAVVIVLIVELVNRVQRRRYVPPPYVDCWPLAACALCGLEPESPVHHDPAGQSFHAWAFR